MNHYMQSPVQSAGQPYGPAQPAQQQNTGQLYGPAQQTQHAHQTPDTQQRAGQQTQYAYQTAGTRRQQYAYQAPGTQQRATQQTQNPFYAQAQNRMPNGGPQNQTAKNSGILGKLLNMQDPIGSLSKIVSIMQLFK